MHNADVYEHAVRIQEFKFALRNVGGILKKKIMTILLVYFGLIFIAIGIIILTLKVSKRKGYKKVGIGIASMIILILLFVPTFFFFEDFFFSKSDANEILKKHGIILSDDFKFESKSISGLMDYTLQFDIQISKYDKERIIKSMANSRYRIYENPDEMYDIRSKVPKSLFRDTILYVTYEEDNYWNLQYCKVLSNGYIQTWDMIQIPKHKNRLQLIRNE